MVVVVVVAVTVVVVVVVVVVLLTVANQPLSHISFVIVQCWYAYDLH